MDLQGDGKRTPTPWGKPAPAHPRFGWRLIILGGLAAIGLFALFSVLPPLAWRDSDAIDIARFGLVGLVLLVSVAASRRSLASIAVGLTIWSLIALLLVALYGYRFELGDVWQRVTAELVPTRGQEGSGGTVSFARSADQHFRIDALVDGQSLRFLVDTGASGVVLTRADAARLGYAPETLKFTQSFETANGVTRGAPIRLRQIRIGPLAFDDVPASVNQGDLGQSLLGMRLLQRLSSIEIRNDTLVIKR
jgi:aspartyl protease family protein